jgi:hypothetical protein
VQILSLRRIAIFVVSLFILVALLFSVNLARFDSEAWFKEQADLAGLPKLSLPTPNKNGPFNGTMVWNDLSLEFGTEQYLEITQLQVQMNRLSIILGQPQIESVTLTAPYLELSNHELTLQSLRIPVVFAFKSLTLTDGIFVNGDTEWHEMQVGMIKNGAFGEYAVQVSGHLRESKSDISFSYSTLLGIDGDDNIHLSKNAFESRFVLDQDLGHLIGKVKDISISPENYITTKFVSWSSEWEQTRFPELPAKLDFAGGLEFGQFKQEQWNLTMLDAAIAFRHTDNKGHTYSLQSTQVDVDGKNINGQLGLSILTEKAVNVTDMNDWQSFNLVMSGAVRDNQPLLLWSKPDIRLAFINGANERTSHNISLKEIDVNPSEQTWQMTDGDWNQLLGDVNTAGYGFGKLSGSWPDLQIIEGPTVTDKLQYPLDLLSEDMVILDALFRRLVP